MNRRDFLTSTAAGIAAALVDSWIPTKTPARSLDLSAFTGRVDVGKSKYDLSRPFVQACVIDVGQRSDWGLAGPRSEWGLARYATDGKICVQVEAAPLDIVDVTATKLPPAWQLGWRHDWHTSGWRSWPKADYIDLPDSRCWICGGVGVIDRNPPDCKTCDGMGCVHEYPNGWTSSKPPDCPTCRGTGCEGQLCPKCDGNGQGLFSGVQRIGSVMVDPQFDLKIRRHLGDCEFYVCGDDPRTASEANRRSGTASDQRPLLIRFAGGRALLMPLDHAATVERMRKAGVI